MTPKLHVEINCDRQEASAYCNWLIARGHEAHVGSTTATRAIFVDPAHWSDVNCDRAKAFESELFGLYCEATPAADRKAKAITSPRDIRHPLTA